MRYFPSATRPRLALLTAGAVATAALVVPLAHAADDDDLKQRQKHVQGQVSDARHDLEEASGAATRAIAHYTSVKAQLGRAAEHLDAVKHDLVAARAKDDRLTAALARAEQRLTEANARLAYGGFETAEAKATARFTVLRSSSQGDLRLRAIGGLLTAGSVDDLARQLAVSDVVLGAGDRAFHDLQSAQAELERQADDVATATADVEKRRRQAARQLVTTRGLYDESQAAKQRLADLTGQARTAKAQAIKAKQRDRARLAALREREQRIHEQLVELARKAKAAAARRAAAAGRSGTGGYTGSSDGFLSYPAQGPVTSPYGYRIHPIYGYYGLHNGTDFGVGCGQPLYASANGTVIDTYYDSVYGNRLYLNVGIVNGHNLVLIYNHLSGYKAHEGDRVSRGDVVGYVGETGWATGCHLHFTVMQDGTAVDPMNYL